WNGFLAHIAHFNAGVKQTLTGFDGLNADGNPRAVSTRGSPYRTLSLTTAADKLKEPPCHPSLPARPLLSCCCYSEGHTSYLPKLGRPRYRSFGHRRNRRAPEHLCSLRNCER